MRNPVAALAAILFAAGCAETPTPPVATPKPTTPPVAEVPKAPADPWKGRTDLYSIPSLTPTTQVSLGQVERFTLPNGLSVLVVPRNNVPSIEYFLAVKAGGDNDPLAQVGVSQFTASMLRKGTAKRSADQIADAIDSIGGDLDASAGDDSTTIGCHARSKDATVCLDLLADVIEHPSFPEAEMTDVRNQLNAVVDQERDNPRALSAVHAANLYFGDDDIRGRPMSKRSIAAIDRKALIAFHKTWYAPNNALLAVSGDVDPKQLKAQLTKAFADWKKRPVPARVARKLPEARTKLAVRLVDKPDATQAQIILMGPGLAHAAPDYYANGLMNYTLGGGVFSSRLMKTVRSEGGKTYGVSSQFASGIDPGHFSVRTFTRTSETAATLQLVLDEIAKMRAGGPTQGELDAAKGHVIGGYGLHLETPSDVASALVGAELDGLDPKYVEEYPKRAEAVTVADAAKAAAAHLAPDTLVILGKADEIKPQLEKAGYPVEEVISYTDPVSAAERKADADDKAHAKAPSAKELAAGKKLLGLALNAKGSAALGKAKQITFHGKGTLTMQGQSLPVAIDQIVVPGHGLREEMEMGPMKIVKVLADGKGFMKQGDQVADMPPPIVEQAKKGLWRNADLILKNASDPGAVVRGLGSVTDGGATFDGLEVVAPDGEITRLLLDPKTHLIARLSYQHDQDRAEQEYTNYQPAAGVAIARSVKVAVGDKMKLELAYEKVEVAAAVSPSVFAR
jgi:zinc protease